MKKKDFSIWAPLAGQAEMVVNGKSYPMKKDAKGWWHRTHDTGSDHCDYSFCIDGSKPVPDPRSLFQPEGVHGPSRVYDHSHFTWEDAGFHPLSLSSAIVYELHTGTFTEEGTFEGCIKKLDYLKDLGITHIEIMPVAEFSGTRGWGYDGVDLFAPHHVYGGPAGLKQLINECHKKDIAVILDVVYNHLGPEGNYLHLYGPYFTDKYKTPWGDAVNLDGPYSNEVRQYIVDNAFMWFRHYHVDGLRIDAIHSLHDMSAVHLLEELAEKIRELESVMNKDLVLIVESDLNDPRFVASREFGGCGIDAQWNDDFHHALHTILTGEQDGYYSDFGSVADLAKAFSDVYVYTGQYSNFRKRNHGREIKALAGNKFVVYSQDHDQIGNRARGDRLSSLVNPVSLKIAAALVLASPFVPMLFQGEEWGASSPFLYFTDHQDHDLGIAVQRGRQEEFSEFGWDPHDIPDPQDAETFLLSKLKWEERKEDPHREILNWYKTLISLRKKHSALSCCDCTAMKTDYSEENKWICIKKRNLCIVCSFSPSSRTIPLTNRDAEILLSSSEEIRVDNDSVEMPGPGVVIIRIL
jgi:maltooligosyltrehalose trehalohydrolase